eukprot:2502992-Rhodomonas_salina.1
MKQPDSPGKSTALSAPVAPLRAFEVEMHETSEHVAQPDVTYKGSHSGSKVYESAKSKAISTASLFAPLLAAGAGERGRR